MKTFFEKFDKEVKKGNASLLSDMAYQGADYPKNYLAFQYKTERHYISYNSGREKCANELKEFIRQEMENLTEEIGNMRMTLSTKANQNMVEFYQGYNKALDNIQELLRVRFEIKN